MASSPSILIHPYSQNEALDSRYIAPVVQQNYCMSLTTEIIILLL